MWWLRDHRGDLLAAGLILAILLLLATAWHWISHQYSEDAIELSGVVTGFGGYLVKSDISPNRVIVHVRLTDGARVSVRHRSSHGPCRVGDQVKLLRIGTLLQLAPGACFTKRPHGATH